MRCEPIKPAAPVTRTLTGERSLLARSRVVCGERIARVDDDARVLRDRAIVHVVVFGKNQDAIGIFDRRDVEHGAVQHSRTGGGAGGTVPIQRARCDVQRNIQPWPPLGPTVQVEIEDRNRAHRGS